MKSLTIYSIDPELVKAIESLAHSTGLSRSEVVKNLLRKALDLDKKKEPRRDFSAFCGVWSAEEAEAFEEAVRPFGKVDQDLWQ